MLALIMTAHAAWLFGLPRIGHIVEVVELGHALTYSIMDNRFERTWIVKRTDHYLDLIGCDIISEKRRSAFGTKAALCIDCNPRSVVRSVISLYPFAEVSVAAVRVWRLKRRHRSIPVRRTEREIMAIGSAAVDGACY